MTRSDDRGQRRSSGLSSRTQSHRLFAGWNSSRSLSCARCLSSPQHCNVSYFYIPACASAARFRLNQAHVSDSSTQLRVVFPCLFGAKPCRYCIHSPRGLLYVFSDWASQSASPRRRERRIAQISPLAAPNIPSRSATLSVILLPQMR